MTLVLSQCSPGVTQCGSTHMQAAPSRIEGFPFVTKYLYSSCESSPYRLLNVTPMLVYIREKFSAGKAEQ